MSISIDEAINLICNLQENQQYEIIPLENCSNRISYENIYAKHNLPCFDNSAMDGYAIKYEDKNKTLEIKNIVYAGDKEDLQIEENTCIKIMTGAKTPLNTTAVIPKEDVQVKNNEITIIKEVKENQHIKYIGEDIKKDELLIKKGENLDFSKIGLLASQGISHVKVYKKPKVIVFSSGEELRPHYENLGKNEIYNSNIPTLYSRINELNCEVTFIGQSEDTLEGLKNLISNSLDADLIITCAGISVGDKDFTNEAFKSFDFELLFKGIEIKPGKPTIFGKIDKTHILNLPGNPLAAALIFELFGRVLVRRLQGQKELLPNTIKAKLFSDLTIKKGRKVMISGFFDGEYFKAEEKASPSMVSSLSRINSFIIVNDDVQNIKKEAFVKVLPISWSFFTEEKKDFYTYE